MSVDTLVECVAFSYKLVLSFFSHPDISAMYLLQDSHLHVGFGVAWQVEVIPSCFNIPVYIAKMFSESIPEAPVCCSNVLLSAVANSTCDGIAQVLCGQSIGLTGPLCGWLQ